MKYRYLRSFANSALGKACTLITGELFPVVRIAGLCPESLLHTPVPELGLPVKTLAACVENRARSLLSSHDLLCVVWSGGLDSSVAAAALLTFKRPEQRVVLALSPVSVKDSPSGALDKLLDMGAEPVDLSEQTVSDLLAAGAYFVDGSQADLVHFTDEWIGIRGLDYQACKQMSPLELTMLRSEASEVECKLALHHLQPVIDRMPADIPRTGYNVHWWVGFISLWDFDLYEMPFTLGYPVQRSYCFFDSDDFQRWALQPPEAKMVAGDARSKGALYAVARALFGADYQFVKNTTTTSTPGPTLKGTKLMLETDFMYIAEDLSYAVRQ